MAYHLEGQLLEVCDCKVLCPCWIGEDPDNGTCKGFMAWHIERGEVDGVDVSDRTVGTLCDIPGNVLAGNWRVAMYLDDRASPEQEKALLAVYQGRLGGPVAELGKLIGEVVSVERVPIEFKMHEGHGHLKVGSVGTAEMEPYRGPDGRVTTLRDSIFSTVPGAPAFVSKASRYQAKNDALGIDVELSGRNAIQSQFVFHA